MSFLIEDAISLGNTDNPTMFGFYEVIMCLLVMYPLEIRCDIVYVPILGTNYVVYIDRSPPVLGYVVNTLEYTSPRHIGCIILPGCDIPDTASKIITQPCPGIYTTVSWHRCRTKLLDTTVCDMTHAESAKKIAAVLKCIGYVSFSMHCSTSATESEFSVSEIMNQLKALFNQEVVEHATNHMKQILKLTAQLERAVSSSVI